MKYKWSLRRFWWSWIKQDIMRFLYCHVYGFNMYGNRNSILPINGDGKYVGVFNRFNIIQIIDHTGEFNEIRIIPYQPNHGVMIESVDKNGEVIWRNNIDIEMLNNLNYRKKEK